MRWYSNCFNIHHTFEQNLFTTETKKKTNNKMYLKKKSKKKVKKITMNSG